MKLMAFSHAPSPAATTEPANSTRLIKVMLPLMVASLFPVDDEDGRVYEPLVVVVAHNPDLAFGILEPEPRHFRILRHGLSGNQVAPRSGDGGGIRERLAGENGTWTADPGAGRGQHDEDCNQPTC